MTADPREGRLLVLSAPSGAGKTTIARALVDRSDRFVFSVSATTRDPRPGEVDGTDYHFVGHDRFQSMIDGGELLEWAEVHGERYGTPFSSVSGHEAEGRVVVLDIDVQGALQVRDRAEDPLLVFVLPPSAEALVGRLRGRSSEEEGEVIRRLRNALRELESAGEFAYGILNDDLEHSVSTVRALVDGDAAGGAIVPEHARVAAVLAGDLRAVLDAEIASQHP